MALRFVPQTHLIFLNFRPTACLPLSCPTGESSDVRPPSTLPPNPTQAFPPTPLTHRKQKKRSPRLPWWRPSRHLPSHLGCSTTVTSPWCRCAVCLQTVSTSPCKVALCSRSPTPALLQGRGGCSISSPCLESCPLQSTPGWPTKRLLLCPKACRGTSPLVIGLLKGRAPVNPEVCAGLWGSGLRQCWLKCRFLGPALGQWNLNLWGNGSW